MIDLLYSQNELTISQYKQAVLENNEAIKGQLENAKAQNLKAREANLITSLYFVSQFLYSDDEREKLQPSVMGSETVSRQYDFGFKQRTPFGQDWALTYQVQFIDIQNVIIANTTNYEAGPKLEIKQSLWRNFFGSEVRSQQQLLKVKSEASSSIESFNFNQSMRSIEDLYFGLAIAEKQIELQKEGLERAKQIRDWAKGRKKRELGEESDYLQANAQVLSSELEWQKSQDQIREIRRKFNVMRNVEGDKVEQSLSLPSLKAVRALRAPAFREREDLQFQKHQATLAKLQAQLVKEQYRPELEIFGQLNYVGRDREYGEARSEGFARDHAWWVIGIKLSAPLDFWSISDVTRGTLIEAQTKEAFAEHYLLDQKQNWETLVDRLSNDKSRYELAQKLEKSQLEKLTLEKERLKKGRTTTYQVLLFELDYLNAQLLTLDSLNETLKTASELKLFDKSELL